MQTTLAGTVAGLAATAPMTGVMLALHRVLPARERYPLPPRQITMRVAEAVGVKQELGEPGREAATAVSHFGYGATAGALYGLLAPHIPGPPLVKGIGFGLAVWTGSYLGWLPAAGILPPATREPARRNALMIAAHVVWGAATGLLTEHLAERRAR